MNRRATGTAAASTRGTSLRRPALGLLAAAIFGACSGEADRRRGHVPVHELDALAEVVLKDAETDSGLTDVRAVTRLRDSILVVDASPPFLHLFREDGSLIGRQGREGEGPGEFQRPWSLVFAEDSLWIADAGRLLVWSGAPLGEIRRQRLPAHAIAISYGCGSSPLAVYGAKGDSTRIQLGLQSLRDTLWHDLHGLPDPAEPLFIFWPYMQPVSGDGLVAIINTNDRKIERLSCAGESREPIRLPDRGLRSIPPQPRGMYPEGNGLVVFYGRRSGVDTTLVLRHSFLTGESTNTFIPADWRVVGVTDSLVWLYQVRLQPRVLGIPRQALATLLRTAAR